MPRDRIEIIEDEFDIIYSDLVDIVDRLSIAQKEDARRICQTAETKFADASTLLQKLRQEIQDFPLTSNPNLSSNTKQKSEKLEKLQQRYRQLIFSIGEKASARDQLLGMDGNVSSGSRGVLLQSHAVLDRTSQSLGRSHQIAAETESIGNEILDELGVQRESLLRTQQRLHDTDQEISRTKKILNIMYWRVLTNKVILFFIILVEIGIIGVLVYWKFFKK